MQLRLTLEIPHRPARLPLGHAAFGLGGLLGGAAALAWVGPPPSATLALVVIAAVALTEALTLDLPDRRDVTTSVLPVLGAAAISLELAVWSAALGSAAAALLRRQPLTLAGFVLGRAALAAALASGVTGAFAPGALGASDLGRAIGGALMFSVVFASVSEVLTYVERRLAGLGASSHVDVILAIALAPLAVAAWSSGDRLGTQGMAAVAGGLIALLVVIRSAVNVSTRHADLRVLQSLAREVAESGSPGESLEVLARGLTRWLVVDGMALALPVDDSSPKTYRRGETSALPDGWESSATLERLARSGPTQVPRQLLPAGLSALAAPYGRRGVLALLRQRAFGADECAILGLLVTQLSATLEQVRLLDEVERERERLAALLSFSGEGIFVLDAEGRLARANSALRALAGFDEAAIGRPMAEVLPFVGPDNRALAASIAEARPGQPIRLDARLTGPAGDERYVSLSYAALPRADGAAGGIGIVRDVTADRLAQQEREHFIDVMTHDLKTPLAAILGNAQLLEASLKRGDSSDRLLRYPERIRQGGQQMLRMITNLLEIARIESGGFEIELSDVALNEVVEQTVTGLAVQIEEKALRITARVPRGLPRLHSSEALLREILDNLVGNAVKYTPFGGAIEVGAEARGDRIRLTVRDSGIGIPPEAMPRVFTRFFRTRQPEVREARGSGLGLALTKMMVEKLDGTIALESELGRGTTCTVELPLGPRPSANL